MKKKFKLGLAPTRRYVFSIEDAHFYKKRVEAKLTEWQIDFVNIDSVNEEGLLIHLQDADRAVEYFQAQDVDAIFAPHVNFGTEEVVCRLAKKMGKPFLLWGPRDEAPLENGTRLRDTQCGLFATSNVLQKYGVPFSYCINSRIDSMVFERGVKTFMAASRAANAFLKARIGQISTRPGNFYTVIINEQELLSRWGIELVPITLVAVEKAVLRMVKDDKRIQEESLAIRSRMGITETDEEMLQRIAALKLFMLDWAKQENLSAIAFKCHEDLQKALGIYPCFANGELATLGVPVCCETDIHGALSAVLVQNACGHDLAPFFADLTIRHPENDNAELLWHCGNFPHSLAKNPEQAFLSGHYVIPPGETGLGNFQLKEGPVTIARFDGMNGDYSLLMGQGKTCDGPYTRGTYLWFETPDWPQWEERIINGPYVHHVAGIHSHCSAALFEACRFIPGLEPDPVQPTDGEIKSWLRGGDLA